MTPERTALLTRRVRWVVAATITYNAVEAVVALTAGHLASSSALVGFGLDSVVEVLSAAAVAWQFAAPDPRTRERAAVRTIAIAFWALAAFVAVDAVRTLLGDAEPDRSPVGIALAAASLAVMPFLSWFERRTGRELGSASAVADSKQTLLCTYLSAVLLVGLVLNATLGWSWADPLAALVIAGLAAREGLEAWRGDTCCTPVVALAAPAADEAAHRGSQDACCSPATSGAAQHDDADGCCSSGR
ncbi:cation transporter [uncultured Pseudokineococcus sp.]|uniref:cation diffusion facilitator family transporter n=1 Tax=uncultured Pseudokineococcus sp. TaxID=1642928 RepID=UPI00343C69C3